MNSVKRYLIEYVIAILFALLIIPILELCIRLIPNIGWHFLTVAYGLIFILQVLYYYLTSIFNIVLSIVSFIMNFLLWIIEQVQLEKVLHDSPFYQGENYKIGVFILGGFLWATNKMLIDALLSKNKKLRKRKSRIEHKLTNPTDSQQ